MRSYFALPLTKQRKKKALAAFAVVLNGQSTHEISAENLFSLPIFDIMEWVMKVDHEKELPKRKPTRLRNFDYNTTGAYFITLCTEGRRQILSRIVGVDVLGAPKSVELLPHGIVADKYIKQMNAFYENITVDPYVIMPNHIHFLLFIREDGSPGTSTPTKQIRLFTPKLLDRTFWIDGFDTYTYK